MRNARNAGRGGIQSRGFGGGGGNRTSDMALMRRLSARPIFRDQRKPFHFRLPRRIVRRMAECAGTSDLADIASHFDDSRPE